MSAPDDLARLLADLAASPNGQPQESPIMSVVDAAAFAAVEEASAAPLLGTADEVVLPAGGMLVFWGTGGGGKTTLEMDLALHLATGISWLGLQVPGRARVLLLENEGPRGSFRRKVARKLAAWTGPTLDGHLLVMDDPWARFTFRDAGLRAQLVEVIRAHRIDVLAAGPVQRLGVEGGGTPEEVLAFIALVEEVRAALERPLAALFVHHANKGGGVAGAWEAVPDTLAHVRGLGPGATRVEFDKVRWSSALHGQAWKLRWTEGEGFELDEEPEVTDDDLRAGILAAVEGNPGCGANELKDAVGGRAERVRALRDELVEAGHLVNVGGGKGGAGGGGMRLYLPDDAPAGAKVPTGTHAGTSLGPPTGAGGGGAKVPGSHVRGPGTRTFAPPVPPTADVRCIACGKRKAQTHPGEPVCRCGGDDARAAGS